MKKQVATINLYINPESQDSSVTSDDGSRRYEITINGGEGDYAVRTIAQFQTTLAHELGHVIALLTKDASHSRKNTFAIQATDTGITQLNIPAEEKAWEFANLIWPDLDKKSEAYSRGTYASTLEKLKARRRERQERERERARYGIVAEPQDVPFEENVMGNVANEETYWSGSKLTHEDLARLATLLADPNAAKWHNAVTPSRVLITVQVLNGATGEIRELVANVAANNEQGAVNKLFSKARRDDYYYRFLGMDSVIAPTIAGAKKVEYQSQTYWAYEPTANWHSHCSQQFMFDALDNRMEYLSDMAMMADTPTLPEPSFDDFGRWEDDGGSCWHNVVVYHGTTRRAAESIKREGLKPNLDGAFKMQRTDAGQIVIENHRLAYVTPVKGMAEAFARLRAKYERAPKGTVLTWTGLYEPDEIREMGEEPAEMRKLSTKREPNAEPAIVEIELPDDWKYRLEPDPAGGESLGFVYQGTIPAEYVADIEPVAWRNAVTPAQASHDLAEMESDLDEDEREESEHYAIDTPDYEPNGAAFARFMREWAEQNSHVTNLWGNVAPTDEPINPVSAPTWFWMAAFALMFLLAVISIACEIACGFAEVL